jgi:ribosomal protein L40E
MATTGVPPTAFQQFKKSKLAIPFILVLTALIAFVLLVFASSVFCLMPALIALISFALPWYFGLKDRKKLAVFGVVLFIFLGLGWGLVRYDIITSAPPLDLSSSNGMLTSGTVEPHRGDGTNLYSFTVTLNGGSNNSDVFVTVYDLWAGIGKRYNMTYDAGLSASLPSNQFVYIVNQTLANSVFQSAFFYRVDSETLVATPYAVGPVGPSNNDILFHELYFEVLVVFLNIGLLFYVILLLTWWMDSNKKKFEAMQKKRAEAAGQTTPPPVGKEGASVTKAEKFVCSACGAEVPSEAKECPQCGEKFDD